MIIFYSADNLIKPCVSSQEVHSSPMMLPFFPFAFGSSMFSKTTRDIEAIYIYIKENWSLNINNNFRLCTDKKTYGERRRHVAYSPSLPIFSYLPIHPALTRQPCHSHDEIKTINYSISIPLVNSTHLEIVSSK